METADVLEEQLRLAYDDLKLARTRRSDAEHTVLAPLREAEEHAQGRVDNLNCRLQYARQQALTGMPRRFREGARHG